MGLKHRLSDASYRVYDRARHRTAFEVAGQPGTAPDFAGLRGQKYALLVTFRSDGTAVPTPVWFALLDDHRFVTRTEERTAKVRRIRRDSRARVFPCDPRGKPLGLALTALHGSWRPGNNPSGRRWSLTVTTGVRGASTKS